MNVVLLRGTLHGEPTDVMLASGEVVRSWELATSLMVTGRDAGSGQSVETVHRVPVRWVEPTKAVRALAAGDEVVVIGSVRRRFFRAGGATASRTEVLGAKAAKTSRNRAVEKLLAEAGELIT